MCSNDPLMTELNKYRNLNGQYPPFLFPVGPEQKESCNIESTILAGRSVSCFNCGGEYRVCIPQVMSIGNLSAEQMKRLVFVSNIVPEIASKGQIDQLKLAGVIPCTNNNCELIRKSDAERLLAKIVPRPKKLLNSIAENGCLVPVFHECFGGCKGCIVSSLNDAERILCDQCKYLFSGENFVLHSHTDDPWNVCHWGFDSLNWRYFIYLDESVEENELALNVFQLLIQQNPKENLKRAFDSKGGERTCEPSLKVPCMAPCTHEPQDIHSFQKLISALQQPINSPTNLLFNSLYLNSILTPLTSQQNVRNILPILLRTNPSVLAEILQQQTQLLAAQSFLQQPNNLQRPIASFDPFNSACAEFEKFLEENICEPKLTEGRTLFFQILSMVRHQREYLFNEIIKKQSAFPFQHLNGSRDST